MPADLDALDRARRHLRRALTCDRLGMVRDNCIMQGAAALNAAGKCDLADLLAEGHDIDIGAVLRMLDAEIAGISQRRAA